MARPKIYNQDTSDKLIAACKAELKQGMKEASLRNLVKEVGTTTNAIYTLFGNRELLIDETVAQELKDRRDKWETIIKENPDQASTLIQEDLLTWALTEPTFYNACFMARPLNSFRRSTRSNEEILGDEVLGPLYASLKGHTLEDWALLRGKIAIEMAKQPR